MAKNQKSYTPEFKQQIIDLYNAGGASYPKLESEYGINRKWCTDITYIHVLKEGWSIWPLSWTYAAARS